MLIRLILLIKKKSPQLTRNKLTTLRLLSLMWTFSSGQKSLVMLEKCPQTNGNAMMNRFWAGNSRHIWKNNNNQVHEMSRFVE